MSKAGIASLVALFLALSAFGSLCAAQSGEEALGQVAEQAGRLREAVTHYVAALQSITDGNDAEQRLREKIIKLVQKLDPPPAVTEDARRLFVRGNTAQKEGHGPNDYDAAIERYKQALQLAPWWADAYFNLASAYELRGNFGDAIRSLKLYLLASQEGPEARQAQDRIYALEEKGESAKRAKAEADKKAKQEYQSGLQSLDGVWTYPENLSGNCVLRHRYRLGVGDTNTLTLSYLECRYENCDLNGSCRGFLLSEVITASVSGHTLTATRTQVADPTSEGMLPDCRNVGTKRFTDHGQGVISEDWREIRLTFRGGFTIQPPCRVVTANRQDTLTLRKSP